MEENKNVDEEILHIINNLFQKVQYKKAISLLFSNNLELLYGMNIKKNIDKNTSDTSGYNLKNKEINIEDALKTKELVIIIVEELEKTLNPKYNILSDTKYFDIEKIYKAMNIMTMAIYKQYQSLY